VAQANHAAAEKVNAFEVGVKGGVQIFPVVSVMLRRCCPAIVKQVAGPARTRAPSL